MSLEKNWGRNYPEFGRWEAATEALVWAEAAARAYLDVPSALGEGKVIVTPNGYDFSQTSTTAKAVVETRTEEVLESYKDLYGDMQTQWVVRTTPIMGTVRTGTPVSMEQMEGRGERPGMERALAKVTAAAAPLPALREAAEAARLEVGDAMVSTVRHCPTYPRLEEAGQILARVGLSHREWELREAFEAAREEQRGAKGASAPTPAATAISAPAGAPRKAKGDVREANNPFAALAALKK